MIYSKTANKVDGFHRNIKENLKGIFEDWFKLDLTQVAEESMTYIAKD